MANNDPRNSTIWIANMADDVTESDVPIGGFFITGNQFRQRRKSNWVTITDYDAILFLREVYILRSEERKMLANPGFGSF